MTSIARVISSGEGLLFPLVLHSSPNPAWGPQANISSPGPKPLAVAPRAKPLKLPGELLPQKVTES